MYCKLSDLSQIILTQMRVRKDFKNKNHIQKDTSIERSGRQASVLRRSAFVRRHGATRNANLGASKIRLP